MHTKLPKNCEIFIFGSFIYSQNPADLDIIIVYDNVDYSSKTIYNKILPFLNYLKFVFKLEVDFYLFSSTEVGNFIKNVKAIKVNSVEEIKLLKNKKEPF